MTSAQQRTSRGPAASRVRLGVVGFGVQGAKLASAAAAIAGVDVTAVADAFDARLERARELFGDACLAVRDYRTILDRRDIDAIIVATPDHLHVPAALQAIDAGKDVYIEAPLSHTEEQGSALRAAASRSDRVIACASELFAAGLLAKARDIVASGRLGPVTRIAASWGTSSAVAAGQTSFPPDASPDTIDFNAFLAHAPRRDFDLKRFFRWRGYWDYGGGLAASRFAPLLAAADELLELKMASRIVAGGGLHRWKDGRETPDVLAAVLDYAEGPTVTLSATLNGAAARSSIRVEGSDASLVLDDRHLMVETATPAEAYSDMAETLPRGYRDWYYMMHGMSNQGQIRMPPDVAAGVEEFPVPDGAVPSIAAALADFVAAVRTRTRSNGALERAARAAATAHRINIAYRDQLRAV